MKRCIVLVAVSLVACAAPAVRPPAPTLETTGVSVTLLWTAPVDLDLYVTDPMMETGYFANPHTTSGGALAHDSRCADGVAPEHAETVRWTRPPSGRYRVGVDFLEACGAEVDEVDFWLVVDVNGVREQRRARARRVGREPLVLEFTVPAATEGAR